MMYADRVFVMANKA